MTAQLVDGKRITPLLLSVRRRNISPFAPIAQIRSALEPFGLSKTGGGWLLSAHTPERKPKRAESLLRGETGACLHARIADCSAARESPPRRVRLWDHSRADSKAVNGRRSLPGIEVALARSLGGTLTVIDFDRCLYLISHLVLSTEGQTTFQQPGPDFSGSGCLLYEILCRWC